MSPPSRADLLTIKIRVSDLEDSTSPDLAVPGDTNFSSPSTSRWTDERGRGLLPPPHRCAGSVLGNGTLESGFGLDGISISMSSWDTGRYFLHLRNPRLHRRRPFHNVLILSSRSIALPDVAVSAEAGTPIPTMPSTSQIQGHDMQQAPPRTTS